VILVDTNLLLYAVDEASPHHEKARSWLQPWLNGPAGVGLPWQVLNGFVRLASNPRVSPNPLPVARAWAMVNEWLQLDATFTPEPTHRHRQILSGLMPAVTRAELVSDAHLAALAMEYGLVLCSSDSDFERFRGLKWENPLLALLPEQGRSP
jgi:toxin-antitoxin system PIN domain toxin